MNKDTFLNDNVIDDSNLAKCDYCGLLMTGMKFRWLTIIRGALMEQLLAVLNVTRVRALLAIK